MAVLLQGNKCCIISTYSALLRKVIPIAQDADVSSMYKFPCIDSICEYYLDCILGHVLVKLINHLNIYLYIL